MNDWEVESTALNNFESLDNFGRLDEADDVRLSQPFSSQNLGHAEMVSSEGDVTRHFHVYIHQPVRAAWASRPFLAFRDRVETPDMATVDATMVVDYMVQAPTPPGVAAAVAVIGEFKKPGVIIQDEWDQDAAPSERTHKLARELLGYAYHYNCHQVFCYDGLHLLILRFQCIGRNDIKSCDPKCWVVPTGFGGVDVTVRRALYSLVRDGYQRIQGRSARDHGSVECDDGRADAEARRARRCGLRSGLLAGRAGHCVGIL
ncbi:unnamed protein product [Zymoseptoria tritici ST99CH_1A5]|uniref:Fungal-type protein kinase domain-containing protein n=2 Tax=Zymoseptoria tritici TaxID=1047171 RepID=A0A1X7RY19_ZYMT9|nr:unnamed protein product [Zymoseptoria tritici ST99CH_3D7]SMY25807.1 unnamed protein product [Zymoseptoria tritici ST99CH_1A5]